MPGKRYLDRIYPYLINHCEDGYYLTDGNGFMLDSNELMDIGENLIKFATIHNNEDIEKYNTKNVERRKKELDNRPFAVNIVYKSPLIEDVYEVEKELHYRFENNKINGEWFNIDNNDIEFIKAYLEGNL